MHDLKPNASVGYGGGYTAARAHRVGVIACGYADGYPRHAPNGTPVLVCGKKVRTAGRVSMDLMTVDLTDVPEAGVGSPVVLWGEGLPVDDVAAAASTVGYRTALRRRAARAVRDDRNRQGRHRTLTSPRETRLYIVVTGAAGFIGSSLDQGVERARRDAAFSPSTTCRARISSAISSIAISPTTSTRTSSCRGLPTATSTTTSPRCCIRALARTPWRPTAATCWPTITAIRWRCCSTARTTTFPSSMRRRLRSTARARSFARNERASRRSTSTAIRSGCSISTSAGMLPDRTAQVAGFRYFNVYGPREAHKGSDGVGRLALSSASIGPPARCSCSRARDGYAAGEQRRDFVSVDDVVRSTSTSSTTPERSGIFNLGSGSAATFNAVATATINACRAAEGVAPLPFEALHRAGAIEYIAFPAGLAGQVPELHPGRSRPACAPPATTAPMRDIEPGRRHVRAGAPCPIPRSTRNIAPALKASGQDRKRLRTRMSTFPWEG